MQEGRGPEEWQTVGEEKAEQGLVQHYSVAISIRLSICTCIIILAHPNRSIMTRVKRKNASPEATASDDLRLLSFYTDLGDNKQTHSVLTIGSYCLAQPPGFLTISARLLRYHMQGR